MEIELYNRAGQVVAKAQVDSADAALLNQRRWYRWRGYACRYEEKRTIYMHRSILGQSPFDSAEVDHVNRDRLDNRRLNLRWVTGAQNKQNVSLRHANTSGLRGVSFDKRDRRWVGRVKVGGHVAWRKYFGSKEAAAIGVAAARRELMPFSVA